MTIEARDSMGDERSGEQRRFEAIAAKFARMPKILGDVSTRRTSIGGHEVYTTYEPPSALYAGQNLRFSIQSKESADQSLLEAELFSLGDWEELDRTERDHRSDLTLGILEMEPDGTLTPRALEETEPWDKREIPIPSHNRAMAVRSFLHFIEKQSI